MEAPDKTGTEGKKYEAAGDYVSRKYLLEEYDRQHKGPPGGARKIIAEAPAADVAPVVHGEWVLSPDDREDSCSICQYKIYGQPYYSRHFIVPYNYCPNCGAKMGWRYSGESTGGRKNDFI